MKEVVFKISTKFEDILVYILIFILAYSGFTKLKTFDAFVGQIKSSQLLLSLKLDALFIAVGFLVIFFLALITLWLPTLRLIGLFLTLSIFIALSIYISLLFLIGKGMPCQCYGIIPYVGWTGHLLFNATFATLCLVALVGRKLQKSFTPHNFNKL